MGMIISPAGKASFTLKELKRDGANLVIVGRMMSAWEVKVYLSFTDTLHAVITAIPLAAVIFIMGLVYSFRRLFRRYDAGVGNYS